MVSNKPIICVRTSDDRDSIGINKYLTQNALNGSFKDLLRYVATESEDQYNSALETPEEKITARKINAFLGSNDDNVKLFSIDSNNRRSENPINLESRVSDHIGSILKNDTANNLEGEPIQYQRADLLYQKVDTGGKYYWFFN